MATFAPTTKARPLQTIRLLMGCTGLQGQVGLEVWPWLDETSLGWRGGVAPATTVIPDL